MNWSSKSVRVLLLFMLCQVLAVSAQEKEEEGDCKAHEVDMGDYCASLSPALTEEEQSRRRVTRFRGNSMMPGRKDDAPVQPAVTGQPVPATPILSTQSAAPKPVPAVLPPAVKTVEMLPSPTTEAEELIADVPPLAIESPPPVEPASPTVTPGPAAVPAIANAGYVVQLGAFSTRAVAESVARDVNSQGIPVALARLEIGSKTLWASFAGPYEQIENAKTARDRLHQDNRFAAAWIKPAKDLSLIGIVDETIEE